MSKTPFTFSHKSSPTKPNAPTKGLSLAERIESQFSLFQKDVVRWKQLHELSVESLSEYISTVGLISLESNDNSDIRTLQIVAKLEKSHQKLVQLVEELGTLIVSMKDKLKNCKLQLNDQIQTPTQLVKYALDQGQYSVQLSSLDYIDIMQQYITIFDQELDVKTVITFSLHEQEKSFILNTYLLTWKKQPFYDPFQITSIDMRLNTHEKMKNKI